ncbi:hypothetical protein [Pectinatus haikarae]|nr:hypothetical protein [Pectinatus haikarae]
MSIDFWVGLILGATSVASAAFFIAACFLGSKKKDMLKSEVIGYDEKGVDK